MKRLAAILLLFLSLPAVTGSRANDAKPGDNVSTPGTVSTVAEQRSNSNSKASEEKDVTVYVTKSGTKYHRANCSHLKSKIPILLSDAEKRYTPCSVCHPPTSVSAKPSKQANSKSPKKSPSSPPSNSKATDLSEPSPNKDYLLDDAPSEQTATGKAIHTGPRGGKYHYSPSGKKVYEKRKK